MDKIDTLFGYESKLSREILDKNIKKFWVSKDFQTSGEAVFKPGEETHVKIRLEKKLFPENLEGISMGMLKHLEISMRSCFAQSGIHIVSNFFTYIDRNDIENLNKVGYMDLEVKVMNRGLAEVKVEDKTDFFRLYFRPRASSITGKKLYDIVKNGNLKIEGAYGTTRCLVGSDIFEMNNKNDFKRIDDYGEGKDLHEDEVDEALTLKLMLNENIFIPNNKNQILITSKKDLVHILEPLDLRRPEHANHNFNIGETYYVDFGEYFGAILYQRYDGGGHHIISPLIDPGFKGPIRTEIVKGNQFNDFIELHIYHKDG